MSGDGYDIPTQLTTAGPIGTEAEVVARVATQAAKPTVLQEDRTYAFVVPNDYRVEEVQGPPEQLKPERKRGSARLLDADSFAAYFLKHHENDQAEIYADPNPSSPTVVGVLNGFGQRQDDTGDSYLGFGDHRVELVFRHIPA